MAITFLPLEDQGDKVAKKTSAPATGGLTLTAEEIAIASQQSVADNNLAIELDNAEKLRLSQEQEDALNKEAEEKAKAEKAEAEKAEAEKAKALTEKEKAEKTAAEKTNK